MGELINNPMLGLEQILFRFHNTFSVRHSRQCFNKTSINKYCLAEFHWSKFLVLKEFTLIRLDANSKRILFLSLAQMNKIMTNFDVCDLFDSNILAGETKWLRDIVQKKGHGITDLDFTLHQLKCQCMPTSLHLLLFTTSFFTTHLEINVKCVVHTWPLSHFLFLLLPAINWCKASV